jgi:hypothetical protein
MGSVDPKRSRLGGAPPAGRDDAIFILIGCAERRRLMTVSSSEIRAPSRKYAVQLIKAGFAQCRFIVSETDSPAICCGAPTDGGSWCTWHRHIVYETVRHRAQPQPVRAASQ